MNNLSGKRILITGATSGIGRCTTIELIKRGAFVAFCGKSPGKMTELVKEIGSLGSQTFYGKAFDLLNEGEIKSFVEEARNKFNGIDVLINCAGLNSARAQVDSIHIADLNYMLQVNLVAPLIFIKQVINEMKQRNEGTIINILSTVCLFSNEGIGAYTASKAGFDALIKVLRKEVRKNNIRISSVYPGGVNTPFRPQARPDYLNPEDVAKAILYALEADKNTALDEIVLRPFIETNFS